MKQILFLCSGNYYRSRFAEHFFNWLAPQVSLPWRADSRGLLVGSVGNVGPISTFAVDALKGLGILVNGTHRDPIALTLDDLLSSDLVVAVKEAEHLQLMEEQFPDWSERIDYWHVDDLDCAGPTVALPLLEEKVQTLVAELQSATETKRSEVA